MSRFKNHLTFLIKCRNNKIIPKGLRITVPSISDKGRRIAEKAGQALVRERIKYVRKQKTVILMEISSIKNQMRDMVSCEVFDKVLAWVRNTAEKVFIRTKERHQKKLTSLLLEHRRSKHLKPRKNTVINLSSYQLDKEEKELLSLGLNYALPPKKLPLMDIIASTEQTARSLEPATAQCLRDNVKSCIADYKPQTSSLNKHQYKALSDLKKKYYQLTKEMPLLLWTDLLTSKK